jgi:hypothetical protein
MMKRREVILGEREGLSEGGEERHTKWISLAGRMGAFGSRFNPNGAG